MEERVDWRMGHPGCIALEIIGDNKNVIDWLNGTALVDASAYKPRVALLIQALAGSWDRNGLITKTASADWFRHVYCELNTKADELANLAMDQQCTSQWSRPKCYLRPFRLRGWFDGGRRNEQLRACGWVLQASFQQETENCTWSSISWANVLLRPRTSSVEAELTGAELVTAAAQKFIAHQLQSTVPQQ